jgi:hypothetical protein
MLQPVAPWARAVREQGIEKREQKKESREKRNDKRQVVSAALRHCLFFGGIENG